MCKSDRHTCALYTTVCFLFRPERPLPSCSDGELPEQLRKSTTSIMISALFLISQKGEVVLNRFFRDDVSRRAADNFRLQVIAAKETGSLPPLKNIDNCSFLYTRHENLYLVAVSRANVNTGACVYNCPHTEGFSPSACTSIATNRAFTLLLLALVFQFLYQLNGIFKEYFGKKYTEVQRHSFDVFFDLQISRCER